MVFLVETRDTGRARLESSLKFRGGGGVSEWARDVIKKVMARQMVYFQRGYELVRRCVEFRIKRNDMAD